jgi:hypothetical protein
MTDAPRRHLLPRPKSSPNQNQNSLSVSSSPTPTSSHPHPHPQDTIYYALFHDGPQTVLMFSRETSIIESISDVRYHSQLYKSSKILKFISTINK